MPDDHEGGDDALGAGLVDAALSFDLACARSGDEAAFTRVYRAIQPRLLRYLTVLVGSDAADVASETWLQVCRDLSTFSGDIDGFRGWVARIGRNRALDHLRAAQRRPATTGPEPLEFLPGPDAPETVVLRELSTEAAIAMIAALPREQAEAVLLRVVMGLDVKAAAQVLGKRPGAVRVAAHRGLRALAARLEQAAGDTAAASVNQNTRRSRRNTSSTFGAEETR